jgi:hypothetical protein
VNLDAPNVAVNSATGMRTWPLGSRDVATNAWIMRGAARAISTLGTLNWCGVSASHVPLYEKCGKKEE